MKKIIFTTFLLFLSIQFCRATDIPTLEFSEINTNSPISDWIEIKINSIPTSEIEIAYDKTIAKITPSLFTDEKFILIHFKSETEEIKTENQILHIYTTKKGLTKTTEQLTIEENEKIIDTVCWISETPAAAELKDMEELKITSNTCTPSDKIKQEQTIAKNQNGTWEISNTGTPGQENTITQAPAKKKKTSEIEASPANSTSNKILKEIQTTQKNTPNTKTSKIETWHYYLLSAAIIITSFLIIISKER